MNCSLAQSSGMHIWQSHNLNCYCFVITALNRWDEKKWERQKIALRSLRLNSHWIGRLYKETKNYAPKEAKVTAPQNIISLQVSFCNEDLNDRKHLNFLYEIFELLFNFITSRLEIFDNFLVSLQGSTARRDPTNKVCYVSNLDPSFPSPGKLKVDMNQVSFDE